MPTDKIHPPGFYPPEFHGALAFRGTGFGYEIARGDKATCLALARKFRAFIKSCESYPLSAGYRTLCHFTASTKVKEVTKRVWNTDPSADNTHWDCPEFICLVVVKRKLSLEEKINAAFA